ncbi:hypothetical protein [Sterolibacterium denitrificans]|uniref:hypothetical protein n=1 Tax=Sterolibacterium denitrificans TaxID=157592 RepID=UPI0012B6A70F|nr:hypothetical protein [Sterolibacterium denitrificans]
MSAILELQIPDWMGREPWPLSINLQAASMRYAEYRIDGAKDVLDWIGRGQIALDASKA